MDWAALVGLIAILVSIWINSSDQKIAIDEQNLKRAAEWSRMETKIEIIENRQATVFCRVFRECGLQAISGNGDNSDESSVSQPKR